MPGQHGYDEEDAAPELPRFSGGMPHQDHEDRDNDEVGNWDRQDRTPAMMQSSQSPSNAASVDVPSSRGFSSSSTEDSSRRSLSQEQQDFGDNAFQLRASSAKDKLMSFTADARLGAQVMRIRTGVDAKMQVIRDSRPVTSVLSRVGLRKSLTASGVPCDPPDCVESEVLDLFTEEPALRQRIQSFHETQAHLDDVLPALQDYQRHRQGLADAEQRLGIALQESGMRQPGPLGQALQDCGTAHRKAADRRLEAAQEEEKHVTSVLLMHSNQAGLDCKRSVQAYEASRHELRLLCEAREKARVTKKQLVESGANRVDSKLAPTVDAAVTETEVRAKERLQATSEAANAKLAMLEAKHKLDYATALSTHLKTVVEEEQCIAGVFGTIGEAVVTIKESGNHADLET